MAHHRPQGEGRRERRRPLRLPRLHRRLVRPACTTPSTTQTKVFTITDRPVYRPEQTVQFKFWVAPRQVRPARQRPPSPTRRSPSASTIPRARRSSRRTSRPTSYGGLAGEFSLPKDATLGVYSIQICDASEPAPRRRQLPRRGIQEARVRGDGRGPEGAGHARREDHRHHQGQVLLRRPGHQGQGEVQGAAHQPRQRAGIRAAAGTGSTAAATGGSPPTTPGIPAGASGAACGPCRWWWPRGHEPPEVVLENEVADRPRRHGARSTSTPLPAKELHGDQDHQYSITAEVVDESRRTIVGTGNVLVARKPFKVFAWVDRGHYRAGDTIKASFTRPDARPASRSRARAS